jgi:hypothetical protein
VRILPFKTMIGAAALLAAPIAFPAGALAQQPTAQSDFSCHALLEQRSLTVRADDRMDPQAKAQLLRNLDVITAFYQGRISQLPADGALAMLNRGKQVVAVLTPAQKDTEAQNCATVYASMAATMDQLDQGIEPSAP